MRIAFAGTPEAALPSLAAIASSHHELVAVITRPDAPTGRGRRLEASPVAQAAATLGVPVLKPSHPRERVFQAELRRLAPECCAVVAYGALLPPSALDLVPQGWVNLHFSCLPAWRGAAPVQHAILAGDEVTGATTFRIVDELDAGPVFGQMTERIRPDDTAGSLLDRLAEGGAQLLLATLDGIAEGRLEARPQPVEGLSFAPKVTVEQAEIGWGAAAELIELAVRAYTPQPGPWTTYLGDRLKLGPVALAPAHPRLHPGQLAVTKQAVHVGTGSLPVRLGEVLPVGKRPMAAADWARGQRVTSDARLGAAPGPEPILG